MKRIILAFIFVTIGVVSFGANNPEKIRVGKFNVVRSGETAEVSFVASAAVKAAASGSTLIYAPVITDGVNKVSLRPILVQGKRAARSWERHEWAALIEARLENAFYMRNGEKLDYSDNVPFQSWMHDSRVEIEEITAGCCNSSERLLVLADAILPAPAPVTVPSIVPAEPLKTFAEELVETFPFVLPASEFDPFNPIKFYDDERDNALTVYYKINKYDIEPGYANNRYTLDKLLESIEIIQRSSEVEVKNIVVAGFASPEGPSELNDRLAWERAASVKEFIAANSSIGAGAISVHNGSADWRGLRLLVSQDTNIPGQWDVLDIIDNQPVWGSGSYDSRMTAIRKLNGGRTYRYLADHVFPKLRNGAFIRVYFDNK